MEIATATPCHAVRHQTVHTREKQDTFANKSVNSLFSKAGPFVFHTGLAADTAVMPLKPQGDILDTGSINSAEPLVVPIYD